MKPLQDVEEEPVFVTDHGLMADGSLSRVGSVTKQHKGRVAAGTVLKSASERGGLAFGIGLSCVPRQFIPEQASHLFPQM